MKSILNLIYPLAHISSGMSVGPQRDLSFHNSDIPIIHFDHPLKRTVLLHLLQLEKYFRCSDDKEFGQWRNGDSLDLMEHFNLCFCQNCCSGILSGPGIHRETRKNDLSAFPECWPDAESLFNVFHSEWLSYPPGLISCWLWGRSVGHAARTMIRLIKFGLKM